MGTLGLIDSGEMGGTVPRLAVRTPGHCDRSTSVIFGRDLHPRSSASTLPASTW
jgi:hypothetical protein